MGVDAADFGNSGRAGLAITNFAGEMIGLYRGQGPGLYQDVAIRAGVGLPSRNRLIGCIFADLDLDGAVDLVTANGHIDDTVRNIRGNVGHAQAPQVVLNQGGGTFRDVAGDVGGGFVVPRVGRGLAYGDFDRDGDVDLLMTTNNGPAVLFATTSSPATRACDSGWWAPHRTETRLGATVRVFHGGVSQFRMVKSGSSYLSQSELPVTFGIGRRDRVDRIVITWPSGRTEEFKDVAAGRAYECVEGKGIGPGS